MTKRWGSKNFGAFLDAVTSERDAELGGRVLGLLAAQSPLAFEQIVQALDVVPSQLSEHLQNASAVGQVEIFVKDSKQFVRLPTVRGPGPTE